VRFELPDGTRIELDSPRVILVGYSSRDGEAARTHIAELAAKGIPGPAEIPAVWEVPPNLLSQADRVDAPEGVTSGEIEPVLLLTTCGTFVTVGSDHTDRDLERTDMDRAKSAHPKIVATECWSVESVRADWDDLVLASEARIRGAWRRYQEGRLAELLPPEWYVERFGGRGDAVVFCGTVPTIGGLDTTADGFRGSLFDPARRRTLSLDYGIGPD
jgi:4-hydroxyphenylacetate 3-monooxygenase